LVTFYRTAKGAPPSVRDGNMRGERSTGYGKGLAHANAKCAVPLTGVSPEAGRYRREWHLLQSL
tara:strand:+ start:1423 stop:1614 length:192 start_codon:yes stop_codon:yes gene_type:complete